MTESVFVLFGGLSFLLAVASLIYSRYAYRKAQRAKRVFSALNLYTIGIFLSVVLVFIPVYYVCYDFGDSHDYIRPLLLAVHNALRVFILDGEFDIIKDAVLECPEAVRVTYSLYAAVLYVMAPVLTFGNVLSLFKNLQGELRFHWHKKRPHYIMSELNSRSVAMAESIVKRYASEKLKPVIVFTDVFEQNEEDDYELLLRVHDMAAICLKKDVSKLNLSKKACKVEVFLLGENESENIEQAINLTKSCKEKTNISIYVFASTPGAGYVVDSLDKGDHTLDPEFTKKLEREPDAVLYGDDWKSNRINIDGGFYIRRIDSVNSLVLNTLSDQSILSAVKADAAERKTFSILIMGMGSYGKHFLKSVLWFFQLGGYKLEINVFDAVSDEERNDGSSIVKRLEQECPEVIRKNPSLEPGDANYDIRFFTGVDCFSSDFDRVFEDKENSERLKRTQLAFVTLGDDDKNIEASVMLRRLFDRIKGVSNQQVKTVDENELPMICSVVYDDKKAANLGISSEGSKLKNYRGTPYNIRFIGSLQAQYSYDLIEENKNIERDAFIYHIDWVRKEKQLRHHYQTSPEFKQQVDDYYRKRGLKWSWGDSYLFASKNTEKPDFDGELKTDEILPLVRNYVNYEYYRQSSISKALHKNSTREYFLDTVNHSDICTCDACDNKRKTEHMRWNAYMRGQGYIQGKARGDRAKVHPDLCVWSELHYLERFKD